MRGLALGLAAVVLAGAATKAEEPKGRTIDDYKVDVLGVRLPAKWFYRNVGVGQPAQPEQETGVSILLENVDGRLRLRNPQGDEPEIALLRIDPANGLNLTIEAVPDGRVRLRREEPNAEGGVHDVSTYEASRFLLVIPGQ